MDAELLRRQDPSNHDAILFQLHGPRILRAALRWLAPDSHAFRAKLKLSCALIIFGLLPKLAAQSLLSDALWSSGGAAGGAVALSPDEKVVASASSGWLIKLWSFADLTLLRTLAGHSNTVNSLAFSSDGQFLVSGSADRTIRIWRTSDGSALRAWTESAPRGVNAIALSPDNALVAAATGTPGYPSHFDGAVRLWNAAGGSLARTLTNGVATVSGVAFSPDGQLVAAAAVNGAVWLWQVSDGALVWSIAGGIGGWSGTVAFSPNGQLLAYGTGSGVSHVGVRRVNDWELLWLNSAHSDVNDLAFSPDNALLISVGNRYYYGPGGETNDPTIMFWNATNGTALGIAPSPSEYVNSVAMTCGGTNFLTGEDGVLRLWNIHGVLERDWTGHAGDLTLEFSPNGDTVATGGGDSIVKLWRGSDGAFLRSLTGHYGSVPAMAFSPDGTQLAYGDAWSTSFLGLFRVGDGGLVWSQGLYPLRLSRLAFSSSGSILAVGEEDESHSRSTITLRSASDGVVFQTISNLTNRIAALTLLSNDQTVVSQTLDGAVKFWQTNGVLSRSFNVAAGPACAAFSSDDTTLAVGYTNREIQLVRLADGAVQRTLRGHLNAITQVAFSTDGQLLYSAAPNELLLWRTVDGILLSSYSDEVLTPISLAASPRGDAFGLGRADGAFIVARKPDFFLPLLPPQNRLLDLRFSGVGGVNYALETSTNLLNWLCWTNYSCSNSPASVTVSLTGPPQRFYRLSRE
jgi:WD40 repeat protein